MNEDLDWDLFLMLCKLRTQLFAVTKPHRPADWSLVQVNIPKTRKTYCKGKECRKHVSFSERAQRPP